MALDPNIALGVRPIEIANPLAQYSQVAQIQNAQNQNALAQYQLENAKRQDLAQNALSAAYQKGFNPDTGAVDNALILKSLAESGAGHLIPDVQAKMFKAQQEQANLKKTTTETTGMEFKQRIDKANKAISDIAALNTPQEAIASIDKHLANGDIDQQKADMLKTQITQAPSFGAWQKGMLVNILDAKEKLTLTAPKPTEVNLNNKKIFLDLNPNSPTFQQEVAPAQKVGMTPYESGRLGYEGQRVGIEGQRLELAKKEDVRKEMGLEALPPKEIQKREAALPQATSAIKGFESKSDGFVNDLQKLRDHPGLSQITGVAAGRLPALTSEGRAAQALYDKVVAKGGFQALQDLRDASKTGGALGNVSNQEGKQLTASFSAIDRRQDAKDVRAAIDQAIGDVQGAKTRMREAYDATYQYKTGRTEAPASNVDALLDKYK
jgi:hypothetical protein